MSVMMDGALMRAPNENPSGGESLAARLDDRRVAETARVAPRPLDDGSEPLSPELALVDPELAAAARSRLPDHVIHPPGPRARALLEILQANARTEPERIAGGRGRRAQRVLTLAARGAAAVALGFAVASVPGSEPWKRAAAAQPSASVPRTAPGAATSTEAPPPPPAAADEQPAQTFAWAPTTGTAAYEFQLFRGAQRIYRARVSEPRLELPRRWTHGGRAHALSAGEYTWYVWPVSPETGRPVRVATVRTRLRVE